MKKFAWLLLIVLAMCSAAKADEVVTLSFTEITVLNGTAQGINTGIPLTFETNNEVLSIAILWAATGTANFPFPNVYGAEDNIVLGGVLVNSVCNYLVQTGPSTFTAIDCGTNGLQAPFVSSVTYSGNWGSAEIGYGGNEPITINSTLTQLTIVPEPSTLLMLGLGLLGLCAVRSKQTSTQQ